MVRPPRALLILAVPILATMAVGCSTQQSAQIAARGEVHDEPSSLTKGQVNLGQKDARDGEDCGGETVSSGSQVTIADAQGKVLGFTSLGNGTLSMNGDDNMMGISARCVFTFEITGVSQGVGPYEISVESVGSQRVGENELGDIQLYVR